MFLFILFLSFLLGCLSTLALLIHLYIRYGLYPAGTTVEQEQYEIYHPLPENDQSKNSAVDAVNYLCQFLFQELKDTAKVRRYIMKKLNIEIQELKKTRFGKLCLQDIIIQNFSIGKECPIFSDIQLDRQERQESKEQNESKLIKEFVAKLNLDYKEGFSVTLDITLTFGYKCQIFLKVKRIQGQLHLEFRHEPFSHWLVVFQDEPFVDFELKAYLSNQESPQLAQIISQQIRHTIRRKQTWPSYKIRYRPFFPTSKQRLPTEVLSNKIDNLIPGIFAITIKHCDRLSIPFEIFPKEKHSSLTIFLTANINENMCKDYLRINRDQWIKQQFELIPNLYRINIKEVQYMNRTEFLIEEFDPIPDGIEDISSFKAALEDKNVFLLQIQGQDVNTLFQINRFLKRQSSIEYDQKLQLVIGIPLLHSVQVRRVENLNTPDESSTTVDQSIEQIDKKPSADDITLIMMNTDCLKTFNAEPTSPKPAKPYIKFDSHFEFPAGPSEQYLNVCLWLKTPLDCDVPDPGKKLILLGYATVPLSVIVLDAHMSFNRETQITLNFRSVYSSKSNLKKLIELSTHKGYDDNMTHGFITINIKHQPEIARQSHQDEKKDELIFIEKDDELFNEEPQLTPSKSSNGHLFEDQTFSVGTLCADCGKKIWMKAGRLCRSCSVSVHKKCEEKFNNGNICIPEPVQTKSTGFEDSLTISNDDTDSRVVTNRYSTKAAAAAAMSMLDSTARRSFRGFGHKQNDQTPTITLSELSKVDESDSNASPSLKKRTISTPPLQTSSKLANAASSAYSKIRDFKTRRLNAPPIVETKKSRSSSDLTAYQNIAEDDLQDIITKCLSNENCDIKSLEALFHEKNVDQTALYMRANELGPELYPDIALEDRRQKFESEISRLQQEIDLQGRIRDEMIIEFNNDLTDENTKKKIESKLAHNEEKVQALRALTMFYCSGLKNCLSQMKAESNSSDEQ